MVNGSLCMFKFFLTKGFVCLFQVRTTLEDIDHHIPMSLTLDILPPNLHRLFIPLNSLQNLHLLLHLHLHHPLRYMYISA